MVEEKKKRGGKFLKYIYVQKPADALNCVVEQYNGIDHYSLMYQAGKCTLTNAEKANCPFFFVENGKCAFLDYCTIRKTEC